MLVPLSFHEDQAGQLEPHRELNGVACCHRYQLSPANQLGFPFNHIFSGQPQQADTGYHLKPFFSAILHSFSKTDFCFSDIRTQIHKRNWLYTRLQQCTFEVTRCHKTISSVERVVLSLACQPQSLIIVGDSVSVSFQFGSDKVNPARCPNVGKFSSVFRVYWLTIFVHRNAAGTE